jgi:hypothetical protein
MLFFVLTHVLSFLLDLVATIRLSDREKDLEILLLRQQVRILQRKRAYAPRISCWEKLALAILAAKLTRLPTSARKRLGQIVVVFKPDTLLQWHRALIRRKWTLKRRRATGRPCIGTELETLIIQLANENPRWGL